MATWKPAKKDTLETISAEILHNYRRGRFMIAVDGIEGSGTTAFADELADALRASAATRDGGPVEVVRASTAHFPGAAAPARDAPADGPAGGTVPRTAAEVYRDEVDHGALRSHLIEPFRSGAPFSLGSPRGMDSAEAGSGSTTAGPDAMLVVDGVFLLRPELRGAWNYSLWLNVPRELADSRLDSDDRLADAGAGADTDTGPDAAAAGARRGARDLYWAEAEPRTTATAIVDNTDLEHPRRVFADSC